MKKSVGRNVIANNEEELDDESLTEGIMKTIEL